MILFLITILYIYILWFVNSTSTLIYRYPHIHHTGMFFEKNNKLTLFQRVIIRDKKFEIIKDQDSSLINMLKVSNGILMRPPYSKSIKPNEKIKILLFDEIDKQKLLTT